MNNSLNVSLNLMPQNIIIKLTHVINVWKKRKFYRRYRTEKFDIRSGIKLPNPLR